MCGERRGRRRKGKEGRKKEGKNSERPLVSPFHSQTHQRRAPDAAHSRQAAWPCKPDRQTDSGFCADKEQSIHRPRLRRRTDLTAVKAPARLCAPSSSSSFPGSISPLPPKPPHALGIVLNTVTVFEAGRKQPFPCCFAVIFVSHHHHRPFIIICFHHGGQQG